MIYAINLLKISILSSYLDILVLKIKENLTQSLSIKKPKLNHCVCVREKKA
jgi:hypothetical protein